MRKEEVAFRLEVDVELTEAVQQRVEALLAPYGSAKEDKSVWSAYLLRYEVGITLRLGTGLLEVSHECLQSLIRDRTTGKLVPRGKRRPFIESVEGKLRLRSERKARPTEYELRLPYTLLSQSWHPPHYPHLLALRTALSDWGVYYFEPKRMREESPLKEVTRLSPSGEGLAGFYYTLRQKNPFQFQNLSSAFRMLIPSVEGLDVERTPEGRLRVKERGIFL